LGGVGAARAASALVPPALIAAINQSINQ